MKEKVKPAEYQLKLYVTGTTPNSVKAIVNTKRICELFLKGRYDLEIIDVYQQPNFAQTEQIIAAPVLLKKFPLPERKLIGDMSDTRKVLIGLGLNDNIAAL